MNIQYFIEFVKRLFLYGKRCLRLFRSLVIVFFIALSANSSRAALEDYTLGARPAALGGAYVAVAGRADALFHNPAAIVRKNGFDLTLYYTHPFGLAELSVGSAALVFPLRSLTAGTGVSTFGTEHYQESVAYFAAALPLLKKVSLGVNLRYSQIKITGYGQAGALIGDLGLVADILPNVSWGFAVKNVNYATIGRSGEAIPQIINTGWCIAPANNIKLMVDVYKDIRFALDIRCGIEYRPIAVLALRAGAGNEPERFSAGFGLSFGFFAADYAFSSHADLGMTHQFSIRFFR